MRDPARIYRITQKLACVWEFQPDTRLCQLLQNTYGYGDNYYFEDDQLEAKLDEILRRL